MSLTVFFQQKEEAGVTLFDGNCINWSTWRNASECELAAPSM
jgi:hypothetical protein